MAFNPNPSFGAFYRAALPNDYILRSVDVLIGRGKSVAEHNGNCYLRELIQFHLFEYSNSDKKRGKTAVLQKVLSIIDEVGGKFVKHDKIEGRWYEVEIAQAKNTIAQGFRDALSQQYKSSRKKRGTATNLTAAPIPDGDLDRKILVRERADRTASSSIPIPDTLFSPPLQEQRHCDSNHRDAYLPTVSFASSNSSSSLSCLQEGNHEALSTGNSVPTRYEVDCFDLLYEHFGSHANLYDNPFIPVQLPRR